MTGHDTRPLEERLLEAIKLRMDSVNPALGQGLASGAAVRSQLELEAEWQRARADDATVRAHSGGAGQVLGTTEPAACRACGQDQPCDTIKRLATIYGVD
jgi:hypothetical protein